MTVTKEHKNEINRAYYHRNKEKILEKVHEDRLKPEVREREHISCAKYRDKNKELIKEKKRIEHRKLKKEVIAHYGGKCSCPGCNVSEIEFLSIDHIEGGGNKQRKELKKYGQTFYRWLKKNDYPEGFRVLCMNCNSAYGFYGYCPHNVIVPSDGTTPIILNASGAQAA